jgi:septum site-determining protein MinC
MPPDAAFYAALDAHLEQTPPFFLNAPVIIDLGQAKGVMQPQDLREMVNQLRSRQLAAFGVQNVASGQAEAAAEAGLILITSGNDVPLKHPQRPRGPSPEVATRAPASQIVTTPVRSGQTVIAEAGDLIVIGSVSSGAELVAAGNIHVYGRLRGRAMAGAFGDETARIFCQSLDAELVAVAGIYRTSEALGPDLRRRSVQISLRDKQLCVEALG